MVVGKCVRKGDDTRSQHGVIDSRYHYVQSVVGFVRRLCHVLLVSSRLKNVIESSYAVTSELTRSSNSSRKPGTLEAGGLYIKAK